MPVDRSAGALRAAVALLAGRLASALSRMLGRGSGGVIGGRVALALDPGVLGRLAAGRRVVLVSGTNGKTTTAHMLATALRSGGRVAHNDTGANMPDGAVTALMAEPSAPWAVLEIDELHVGQVADDVHPAAVVLLNLTRDQLDRGSEVRAVADSLAAALARHPGTLVVANADDPVVVGAVGAAPHVVWVGAGSGWQADAGTCPACGGPMEDQGGSWFCRCGLRRPDPAWQVEEGGVRGPAGAVPLRLRLPGRYNIGNAALALAAADAVGVAAKPAAEAIASLRSVHGRYAVVHRDGRLLHLLLAKNPAGWAETLPLLAGSTSLLLALNAHEADGRDTSWVWDVPFEELPVLPTVVSGERAADLGLRLSYAEREHCTEPDLALALDRLPPGDVAVVANYTAFLQLLALVAPGDAP